MGGSSSAPSVCGILALALVEGLGAVDELLVALVAATVDTVIDPLLTALTMAAAELVVSV